MVESKTLSNFKMKETKLNDTIAKNTLMLKKNMMLAEIFEIFEYKINEMWTKAKSARLLVLQQFWTNETSYKTDFLNAV